MYKYVQYICVCMYVLCVAERNIYFYLFIYLLSTVYVCKVWTQRFTGTPTLNPYSEYCTVYSNPVPVRFYSCNTNLPVQ